jgi:hypothetical protein
MADQTRGDGSRAAVMASSPRQPAAEQGDRSSPSAGGRDQAAITRASFCGRLLLEAVVILGLTEAAYRVWNHVRFSFRTSAGCEWTRPSLGRGHNSTRSWAGFRSRTIRAVPD